MRCASTLQMFSNKCEDDQDLHRKSVSRQKLVYFDNPALTGYGVHQMHVMHPTFLHEGFGEQ